MMGRNVWSNIMIKDRILWTHLWDRIQGQVKPRVTSRIEERLWVSFYPRIWDCISNGLMDE